MYEIIRMLEDLVVKRFLNYIWKSLFFSVYMITNILKFDEYFYYFFSQKYTPPEVYRNFGGVYNIWVLIY